MDVFFRWTSGSFRRFSMLFFSLGLGLFAGLDGLSPEGKMGPVFSGPDAVEAFAKGFLENGAGALSGPKIFESAEPLMEAYSPEALVLFLEANPMMKEGVLSALAEGLDSKSGIPTPSVEIYLQHLMRQAGYELQADRMSLSEFFSYLVLDIDRFSNNETYRQRIMEILPKAVPQDLNPNLKREVLAVLVYFPGMDFDTLETLQIAWQIVKRDSRTRQAGPGGRSQLKPLEGSGNIALSMYSLPAQLFSYEEATRFLDTIRKLGEQREIVVLSDLNLYAPFKAFCKKNDIDLIETSVPFYSPWPRDPMIFAQSEGDRLLIVQRPNTQASREMDDYMARELVHGLPEKLDFKWGGVHWDKAATPFHNGKILLGHDRVWINLDTVEIRTLEILGLDRVPVQSFRTEKGIRTYLEAANQAASELAKLFGKPVSFIDPLPWDGPLQRKIAIMFILGGGAGYDLDSLVTLLPNGQGAQTALVGDVNLAKDMIAEVSGVEWRQFSQGYKFAGAPEARRDEILAYQDESRGAKLNQYLDLVSAYLSAVGLEVKRLPLFLVPENAVRGRENSGGDFLVSWNNVVLEKSQDGAFAEGFTAMLEPGDAFAKKVFAEAGFQLRFVPPLLESIYRNGGYRCASKHLRR